MKIEYEKISPDSGSSFRMIHWKSENDKFFWHYHPEYEIVFVRKGSGRRHIGTNLANFEEGELVFMGPNLPHTGFGYGIVGEHEEIVVQLREDFLGESFLKSPEMQSISRLFERSKQGISFHGKTQKRVGQRLNQMLQMPYFERLIELLNIFQLLSTTEEFEVLNPTDLRFDFSRKDEDRINKIYTYIEQNFKKMIDMHEVANIANLTIPSFCRYFKKMTNLTFTDFVNEFRINQAQKLLYENYPITDVCFESGFNNISHFNKTFKHLTGKSPTEYKKWIKKS